MSTEPTLVVTEHSVADLESRDATADRLDYSRELSPEDRPRCLATLGGEVMAVYAAVLRSFVPVMYWAVNSGRYWLVLALCRPDVVARMTGDTPLSGTYASRAAYRSWFERVASMCTLHLAVQNVRVTGTITRTRLEVAWTDRVVTPDGAAFGGSGRHLAELRWGRIAAITYDWDVETVQAACNHAAGIAHA